MPAPTNQVEEKQPNIGHLTGLEFSIGNLDTVSITKHSKSYQAQNERSSEMSCVAGSFPPNAGTLLPVYRFGLPVKRHRLRIH